MHIFFKTNLLSLFLAMTSIANAQDKNIETFFADHLAGKANNYTSSKTIKVSQIKQWQDRVWAVWKQANQARQEEKLISARRLDAWSKGKWTLPDSLEPHAMMQYCYWRKADSTQTGRLPLYLYLHGSGPSEQEWYTGVKLSTIFKDAPCIYFIPKIPNEGNYYRWWQKAKQYAWEKLIRLALAGDDVDANRLYVFGISEGGYGSQRLASFYADYLAAAGPMAGGEPLRNAPVENCANIGFSFLTGALDNGFYRNYFTRATQQAFDSLQALHPNLFDHRIELVPDRGHAIDYRPTTPWLSQHVRNPYPKQVYWEDFEMDGRYRDGFYNLYINERSNKSADTRTYYEMSIQGNTIDMKVSEVTYTILQRDPNWGIEMSFKRSYKPATSGKFTIYLNDQLVDLNKSVTLLVKGKQMFHGKVKTDVKNLVNSCAVFFDPYRLYPAAIEVTL